MSDEEGGVNVSANGHGTMTSDESPRHAPSGLDDRSIDQRLSALRDTIQTWDWRTPAADNGAGTPAVPKADDATADHLVDTSAAPSASINVPAPVAMPQDEGEVLEEHPAPTAATAAPVGAAESSDPGTLLVTSATPAVAEQPAPPVTGPVPIADPLGTTPEPVGPSPDLPMAPIPLIDDDRETRPGLWSRRSTKIVVVALVVVIAATLGIVWALGHRNNHTNSGHSTAATGVTQPATHTSSSQSTTTTVATPLTPAQMTQYDGYATALETANGAASAGLAGLGSSPSVAGVTPLITSYLAALNLYNLQIHFVQWPASMQADVQADYSQLSAFLGFLPTLNAVTPTTLSAWLTQLHTVGGATQAADNRVRHTLGLTPSTSFP